jgi:branched-chain amino acid transport system ATP-binding protein
MFVATSAPQGWTPTPNPSPQGGGEQSGGRGRERTELEDGSMTTPILELLNVESNYGPVQALRGVSLSVTEGKIVTVLGANGAGKTTTLKTISGIIAPLKGQVKFRGQEIQGRSPDAIVRGGIVHVPEGREVFPLLSVEDNLRMGAYTRSDSEGIARDLEAVFGYFPILRERRSQEAGQLSGGQQQMLAIARALLAQPALILMDEPSLGLSPKLTREIFDIVVRINRERGVTILLVEQNAHMALKIADFGYVLEVGRIVMEDTGARLAEKEDIREFYLGMKAGGVRGTRRWKRKKLWR